MAASDPLSQRDYRALAEFRYALRIFLRFSEDAAREAGVTPAHHQLMLVVKGWGGEAPPTISDLAQRLQLKSHSTAELVGRASAAGLVEGSVDEDDGRRHLVRLTEAGESLLASLSVQHRDELRRFRTEMTNILHELA